MTDNWLEDLQHELTDPHEASLKHAHERVFQAHVDGNVIRLGVPDDAHECAHIMWAVIESFRTEQLLADMNERLLKGRGAVSTEKDYVSGLDDTFPYAELSWMDRNEIWSDSYVRVEASPQADGFALLVNGSEVEPRDPALREALKDAFRTPQRRRRDETWEW
ncbi:MAG: hypothetical protein WEB00_10250 [Dehalococcoidia bacterium]